MVGTQASNCLSTNRFASGSVKFDGCTNFEVSNVHVDSREQLITLLNTIEAAREECALVMPGSLVHEEYA